MWTWVSQYQNVKIIPDFIGAKGDGGGADNWLGLPNGHFQSAGSPRITAATARWWSSWNSKTSCGQYVQRAANVCQWPGGREDGIRWLLWLPHSSHGEYMVSSGSCVVPTCHVKCINVRANWSQHFIYYHPEKQPGISSSVVSAREVLRENLFAMNT